MGVRFTKKSWRHGILNFFSLSRYNSNQYCQITNVRPPSSLLLPPIRKQNAHRRWLFHVMFFFRTPRYHWRTPYTGMTEAEIVNHLKQAREFAFSDDAAGTCIASKVPCCLTWAATKLETDYLFGEVDELDGTIKVIHQYSPIPHHHQPIHHSS